MGNTTLNLTDKAIKAAKPKDKLYKPSHLWGYPNGWRSSGTTGEKSNRCCPRVKWQEEKKAKENTLSFHTELQVHFSRQYV